MTDSSSSLPKLVLIDAYSLLFRAFFGSQNFTTVDNRPTGALYGFTNMLFSILSSEQPEAIVVCWDAHSPTLRKQEFEAYKAHRPETDDRLIQQMPVARELVKAFGIQSAELDGYEADDLIGTLAERGGRDGYEVAIFTGDSDQLQLVGGNTTVRMTVRGVTDVKIYNAEAVYERYGVTPGQIADYKALTGDTSDNIPGVPGIGEKTASSLLQKFGDLESLLGRKEEVTPPRIRGLIEQYEEQARISLRLATIHRDAPIDLKIVHYEPTSQNRSELKALFENLEFRSQLTRVSQLGNISEEEVYEQKPTGKLDVQFHLIKTDTELLEAIAVCQKASHVSIQPVLDGSGHKAKIKGLALAISEDAAWYLSIADDTPGKQNLLFGEESHFEISKDPIKAFLGSGIKFVTYNAKQTISALLNHNSVGISIHFDAMLAAYLIGSSQTELALSKLCDRYLSCSLETSSDKDKSQQAMLEAAVIFRLEKVMSVKLDEMSLLSVMEKVDLPLIPVLAAVEHEGLRLDIGYLNTLGERLNNYIQKLTLEIHEIVGYEFNISSTKQLQEVLFQKLQLPHGKKTKTGYSTDNDVLETLVGHHEIAGKIMEYREQSKLKATYTDALARLVDPETNRVYTSLNQTVAATGRLSSSDPNLQNIPVRTEVGREIRRAFVAPNSRKLLSCDYSQVELRVLAHVSGDPTLTEAFKNGEDIHTATASIVFDVDLDKVSRDQRRQAKTINFAVLYGQSAFSLSSTLGVEVSVAREWINEYFDRLPGVKRYVDDTKSTAKQRGYVQTMMGRRRYMPELESPNHVMRAAAERAAVNMPIQGAAADIMKIAMIHVYDWLQTEAPKGCNMLLQVHDELLFEIDEGTESIYAPKIVKLMEEAYPLNVPLEVDAKLGPNWADMEPLKLV